MDAKRIDEHASRKLAICQLWRDGQLSAKDCERQCGEQDALLAVEAVAEQIAAHVRDFHGPASAVENDTAADVKPYRCHATSERDFVWKYNDDGGRVWSADGKYTGEKTTTLESMNGHPVVPLAEADALIAKWQAEKPSPAPTPSQAPERVLVTHHPKDGALGTALALGDPYALRPSIRWEAVEYVRLDIAEGLNGKLALANARLAELERNIGYYRQIIADAAVRMQSEADALRKR